MMELEYYLFSQEDPIAALKDLTSEMSTHRKRTVAPLIRRAEAMVKKCKPFREILFMGDDFSEMIATSFVIYFDQMVSKGKFVAVSKDPSFEFVKYVSGMMGGRKLVDDKYLKKVNTFIINKSDAIDAFIKAFISIRLAKSEIDKLS